MDAYSGLAGVYDIFMDQTPYEEWCKRITDCIEKYGISKPVRIDTDGQDISEEQLLESERNLVLDLGCGTGILTQMLYDLGYDMIGIDNSTEMLTKAFERKEETQSDIMYLCQDMRELDLYSTIGTVVSVCDSVNYITEPDELLDVFSSVENYLYPGGLFLFDFNTLHKYRDVIGDSTIAEDRDDCAFIWDNYFDEESSINEYDLTIFTREDGDRFVRTQETHFQRGYTLSEIQDLLKQAGLSVIKTIDSDSEDAPSEESERIFVVAKKEV